jgi:hypothetical protein
MKRLLLSLGTAALLALLLAAPASAAFGLSKMEVNFINPEGGPAVGAGSHPFAQEISFEVNSHEAEGGGKIVDGALRNLDIVVPAGLIGNRTATPRCEAIDFVTLIGGERSSCPAATTVGALTVRLANLGKEGERTAPVYNLIPAPGVPAKLGFVIQEVPITANLTIRPTPPYNVVGKLANATQVLEVLGSELTLWGNPSDPAHDGERGLCGYDFGPEAETDADCPVDIPAKPFLTLPRSCTGPLVTDFEALSWWSGEDPLHPEPPTEFKGSALSPGMIECSELGFAAHQEAQPTTQSADSPTGLEFNLDLEDEGINDVDQRAHSDIKKAVITFPEGMTANPSVAEGLATCSPTDLARENANSPPGEGCPQASKVGTVEAETPILENKVLKGELFIASQDDPTTPEPGAENPFDSLLAIYTVIKDPELGVIIKLAGKLEPDPQTGQLVTTLDDLPQVPVSHVRVRLREGGRSPLVSPPTCGTYTTRSTLTPSGDPAHPVTLSSDFQITRGVGGGDCPPGGTPPFAPGFQAGTLNNNAATFSPLSLRLTRRDGDQDLTRFDANLPPGLLAKLAGVGKCSDGAIAAAKTKRGKAEQASPSCPSNSQIGTVIGGAGVGNELTYASGKLYLAGPFGGAPLSVVGIVPAVAGPFDVGTIVVRQALNVNPKTAVGEIDGAHSDPIPHILAGIPLRVRDIRVLVDRPEFTLNPTDCDPFAFKAQIWGGGQNQFSQADDAPATRSARFRAANCSRLGFKPRLSLVLKGGTKRGDHPAFEGIFRPRENNANISELIARLPRSAFLDQAHIRTICTRVQFAAKACPPGAVYGKATAFSPLLEEPLKGPVYLRSSNHKLPDMVLDLHGLVDVEVSARIDSIKGGIRASFEDIPDAPLSKTVLQMRGGKKGLIVNSRNLCGQTSRANLDMSAHNGKRRKARPELKAKGCGKSGRGRG